MSSLIEGHGAGVPITKNKIMPKNDLSATLQSDIAINAMWQLHVRLKRWKHKMEFGSMHLKNNECLVCHFKTKATHCWDVIWSELLNRSNTTNLS